MRETSPVLLSKYLGQEFPPTEQQAAIIGDRPGPLLVVAGAGAGKTETMAARVVWLVANGLARPDEILGLTFTRKAAQELGRRIRQRLQTLAGVPAIRDIDPTGELEKSLTSIAPTVSTYDSYAGQLIREYGLLVPVEPAARIITDADLYAIAHEVVSDYTGELGATQQVATVTKNLLKLIDEMNNQVMSSEDLIEETRAFLLGMEELPLDGTKDYTKPSLKWPEVQKLRLQYLPLIQALRAELKRRDVVTFNEQMSVAARLAAEHPAIGAGQRSRYKVVMLDEYQDTSHAQRILLSSLFGQVDEGSTVTAVGDPMQSIYGWRGATAENLTAFVEDFRLGTATTAKKELTTSWRNPPEILALANAVSDSVLGRGSERAVAALEPRKGASPGEVTLGFYADQNDEITAVADLMAREFHARKEAGEKFTGAVLVRANKHSQPIADALNERGIPFEIVGRGGLLRTPEVADIVALATMLIRPQNSTAALRVLTGPMVGLGLSDLVALGRRAKNLTGQGKTVDHPEGAMERLASQLAELTADPPDQVPGLTDAVADLGERGRYSAEGVRRLELLSSRLRQLRTTSLSKALPDLFTDIETVFQVRTEVLASGNIAGAVHLDRLHDEVAAYSGDTLSGLLDYFALALTHEDGLKPGEVTVREDQVQILTAHKAKGLEWDVVAVVHADSSTYQATVSTFLTNVTKVPDPSFTALAEAEDRKDFERLVNGAKATKTRDEVVGWLQERRKAEEEEASRLFYVAITRSERVLSVTGSRRITNADPYEHLRRLTEIAPQAVVAWETEKPEASEDADVPSGPEPETGMFPQLQPTPQALAGADMVRRAMADLPAQAAGETFDFWEREASALIEEWEAARAPVVNVELPGELTATDLVNLRADALQFARRQRRPVPFKPNQYAKRGTAFHEWLEDRFGASALLDEEQLPGIDEAPVDADHLAQLKESFLASEWAERTPQFVEQPFEVSIGNAIVRGRMDAVFRDPDNPEGWLIVDWKTGRPPSGADRKAAIIQLAVYREAWLRILDDPHAPVRAAFHYVGWGETLEPHDLPSRKDLEGLLADAVVDKQ
ncbi:ATP-dependent helicase [Corynebacterium sp.]|uniref:ATP-dependent helicase n=1 Tax=Corynebacterium sp. TaxID=1720 RepID=UPI0026E02523|nr:UvrD-helicase domain-containing protein [Corynebacterium sp.]MDO5512249.1 UvrD-helicase domain-containing protein [Corynebacterium sp.]